MADASACDPIWMTYSYKHTERLSEGALAKQTVDINYEIVEGANNLTQEGAKLLIEQHEMLSKYCYGEAAQRAFWIYYYEVLRAAEDTDSDQLNDQDIQFSIKVLEDYMGMMKLRRNYYIKTAVRNCAARPALVMPATLILPAIDQDASDTSCERAFKRGSLRKIADYDFEQYSLAELKAQLDEEMEIFPFLRAKISASTVTNLKRSLKDFDIIRSQFQRSVVKIGVVGTTGAGKSTSINAILGVKIVPTSPLKACTPFYIEIGYAENPDETHPITVLITYIDSDSFRDEVQGCLSTFRSARDENANISEHALSVQDDDFCTVRKKILSISPEFASKGLAKLTQDEILQHPNLAGLLGNEVIKTFTRSTDAHAYINTLFNNDLKVGQVVWPWIQGAKISLRHHLLQSGIVLVDLPGTHDTNSARASAARKHMDDCTALWILTPIVRAADDTKTADLVSLAFRHSFHLENMSLVIVGTKSDADMQDPTDVSAALGVKAEVDELQAKIDSLYDEDDSVSGPDFGYSEDLDGYETHQETGEKRKRSSEMIEAGKSDAAEPELELRTRMWKICIEARNRDVDKAIRSALVKGIEESQELSLLCDDNSMGRAPKLNGQVISDIVATIPIVCTSAMSYNNLLARRNQKGRRSALAETGVQCAFSTSADTGIPRLVQIAKEQSQAMERSHVIKLLLQIWKLWNSLLLACSGSAFGNNVTGEQLSKAVHALDEQFPISQQIVHKYLKVNEEELDSAALRLVLTKLEKACKDAQGKAHGAYKDFKQSIKSSMTFKAIMLRQGEFSGNDNVLHNLNAIFGDLLFGLLGAGWKELFSKKLSEIVKKEKNNCLIQIEEMHEMILKLAGEIGCSPKASKLLEQQIVRYRDELDTATRHRYQSVQFGQRGTRYRLNAVIQAELSTSYTKAATISGKGCGDIMKEQMKRALTTKVRKEMYEKATQQLDDEIQALLKTTGAKYKNDVDDILARMQADYRDLFSWKKGEEHAEDSRFQLEILNMLEKHTSITLQGVLKDIVRKVQPSWVIQKLPDEPEIKKEDAEAEQSLRIPEQDTTNA